MSDRGFNTQNLSLIFTYLGLISTRCKLYDYMVWQIDGEILETVADFIFWAPKSLWMVIAAMKLKDACSLKGKSWPT